MTSTLAKAPEQSAQPDQRSSPLDVVLVVLVLGFAVLGLRPLADPDVWWHLRTGEMIVHSGFTTSDPWSFASTKPWLLHEWGSEVLMYLSYAVGGYRGVIVLHSLGMMALAAILLRSVRRVAAPVPSLVVGFLALVALLPGTGERPQLVSWCLLAATLPALRGSIRARRPPFWLIPVIWLWANLHGLWSGTLVLYGCLVLGLALEVGWRQWRICRSFVAIGLLSIAAATLTPNGPALLLTPLEVREYAGFVSEWQPPSLLSPFFGSAFLLLAVVVIGWARSERTIPASEVTFVIGAAFVGLSYLRTVPVLVIALAPLAASGLHRMLYGQVPRTPLLSSANKALSAAVVAAFVVTAVIWIPRLPVVQRHAPWEASEVLDALPGRARVLNEYVVGGWLLWTARDTSPAIDGRTEIYAPDYVADAMGAPRMATGWRQFVEEGRFDAAWLGKDAPLTYGLKSLGWRVAYQDRYRAVLVPPS